MSGLKKTKITSPVMKQDKPNSVQDKALIGQLKEHIIKKLDDKTHPENVLKAALIINLWLQK